MSSERPGDRPRGRRAGGEGARDDVVQAARAEFAERGYEGTSLRGVARRADVDPALVRYYFPGGKGELFAASVGRPGVDPAVVVGGALQGDPAQVGVRFVRAVVGLWDADDGPTRLRALLAAQAGGLELPVQGFLGREVLRRLAAAFPGDDAPTRVALAASQLLGVLVARHVLRLEPIASMSADDVAAWVGPAVQRHLAP